MGLQLYLPDGYKSIYLWVLIEYFKLEIEAEFAEVGR
jgi:hypothetical protein